jgi:heme/copper-type cytochrome/quinol oxidase subunit 2
VTVSTTVPAAAPAATAVPSVRFAALRGRVPLPWVAVTALAILLALGNGFVIVAVQGAVGAIERAQGPFTMWLRYSALLTPVFGLAVVLAFGRAHRKARGTVATALLVAAAATAVGIVVLIISTAYDYHLQSALLTKTAGLHAHLGSGGASTDPAYADSAWSPQQRDTMRVEVKGVGYGVALMAGINAVLVGWVTALRGGRLGVRAGTSR